MSNPHKRYVRTKAAAEYAGIPPSTLDQAAAAGRNLSDSRNAGNYAPRVLQQMPTGRSFKIRDLERAMNRLFGDGAIRMVPYGRPSKGTTRMERILL